jgi:ubiquinone/menaquinone biosynthesis C-methylase UbiE
MPHSRDSYILGHSDSELHRLQQQGEIFGEATVEVFRRAGIGRGMRVLDVGCGAGDVSLIVGELVGPEGSVLGVDRTREAVETAAERVAARGLSHIRFTMGELNRLDDLGEFDAIVGRFILLHLADPAETLRQLARRAPDGVLAFVEMDIGAAGVVPPIPLFDQSVAWIVELYRATGVEPDMGSRLYATFREAGLSPQLLGSARVEGSEGGQIYRYLTESLRSLAPAMVTLGIASADQIGLDSFAQRLSAAAAAADHCFIFPRIVGAWARPGQS